MTIEGYIKQRTIRQWLDNYQALAAGDVALDAIPGNSGPKEYDGVSSQQLNKIMLDKAIEALPLVLQVTVSARWISRVPLGKTLKMMNLSKSVYYRRCDLAVATITRSVNGRAVNYKKLMDEIKNT